ncbi:tRNA-guanine transglycosylase DpdA [Anabaena azotica]|uniref:tRNA-guanine transglycosylase DpdA n=1 Tax=Anabaena azotica TaxID=197653 RepID=UPI0018F018C7|nr:tRNA-guanine transglycosylase DpdA [Anabaena azotica]
MIRTLIITSCTGEKRHQVSNQLTINDFKEPSKINDRSEELSQFRQPAAQMYTGLQHLKVMDAVNTFRLSLGQDAVSLKIISAGYGLISENKEIVPYSVTFNTMKSAEIDSWSSFLKLHDDFQAAISEYDLVFVLLGDKYLRALNLPVQTRPNQTLIFLCSNQSTKFIDPGKAKYYVLPLSNSDASRFGCALVGLKGKLLEKISNEVAKRKGVLEEIYHEPAMVSEIFKPKQKQLELFVIESDISEEKQIKLKKSNDLEKILLLPAAVNQHLKMEYFIPDWDDKVDEFYDFINDKFSPNRKTQNDIYAHELYSEPTYDGILVSKTVMDKSKYKIAHIQNLGGIHKYLRFPGKVMGDCGAFGYIKLQNPPYTTGEILDYYEKLGFDYGVSIDHLIVGPFKEPGIREHRYELTLSNAEDFITKHNNLGYNFTPIGVAQGWNAESYGNAAKSLIEMGYQYIAVGGVAMSPTIEILEILQEVYKHLKPDTKLHLFGVGRIDALPYFRHLGVTSFDSSSPLRKAWLDAKDNYHLDGKAYAAVRIPYVDKPSSTINHLLSEGKCDRVKLKELEQRALEVIRNYDSGIVSLEDALSSLMDYDEVLQIARNGKKQSRNRELYKELLEVKPWQRCECEICRKYGVEISIFRGSDRNRRRGFHNTYIFYKRFQQFLASKGFE